MRKLFVGIRLEEDLRDKVRAQAEQERTTVSQIVRRTLAEKYDKRKKGRTQ